MSLQIMLIIHIAIACFLIAIILLQQGKGADVGATFGGGGGTLFGAAGADNLLTRVTAFAAFGFMATSIILATMQRPANANSGGTLFDNLPETTSAAATGANAVNGVVNGTAAGSVDQAAPAASSTGSSAVDSSAVTGEEASKKPHAKSGTPIPEAAEPKVLKLDSGQNQSSKIETNKIKAQKATAAVTENASQAASKTASAVENLTTDKLPATKAVVEQAVTDKAVTGRSVVEKVITENTITEKAAGLVEKVVSEVEKKN